jgi:hypothetical protein
LLHAHPGGIRYEDHCAKILPAGKVPGGGDPKSLAFAECQIPFVNITR